MQDYIANEKQYQDQNKCRCHNWLVFRGKYDEKTNKYFANCGDVYCPIHSEVCRKATTGRLIDIALSSSYTHFYSFILHFPWLTSTKIGKLNSVVRKVVHQVNKQAKVYVFPHYLHERDVGYQWHLHVGVTLVDKPQLAKASIGCVPLQGTTKSRGRKKKEYSIWELPERIKSVITEYKVSVSEVEEREHDNLKSWIFYCMRYHQGFAINETPWKGWGYRAYYGFMKTRNK